MLGTGGGRFFGGQHAAGTTPGPSLREARLWLSSFQGKIPPRLSQKGITGKLLRCKLRAKINLETIRFNSIQQKTLKPRAVEPNTRKNELWRAARPRQGAGRADAARSRSRAVGRSSLHRGPLANTRIGERKNKQTLLCLSKPY